MLFNRTTPQRPTQATEAKESRVSLLRDQLTHKGQSTIEFLLTFALSLGLLFIFISLALNFSVGYIQHWTTFVAARVFLSHDSGAVNPAAAYTQAEQKARSVFDSIDLSQASTPKGQLVFNRPDNTSIYEYVGAHQRQNRPLSFVKTIGGGTKIDMLSEAFLGKEPTRGACRERICYRMMGQASCRGDADVTLFDNGC